MRKWTKEENDGRVALNLLLRNSVAPSLGKMLPAQNAEFIRILAECFETTVRYASLWTTLGAQRRPFIVSTQPEPIIEQKVILALLMTKAVDVPTSRRSFLVLCKGSNRNLLEPTLKTLLAGPYYDDQLFNWDFNNYSWGPPRPEGEQASLDFHLRWEYKSYYIPDWLPPELRPITEGDPSPF